MLFLDLSNFNKRSIFFLNIQLLGQGKQLHPAVSPDQTDQRLKEYLEKGKTLEHFDHIWMGLDMFTMPTKHFGWKGMTEAFRKVLAT